MVKLQKTVPGPVKCLIVDDLPENLLALSALLRGDGVEIFEAQSGPAALEVLLRHDVAVAFLDVQMPGMDGFELAELIRSSERTRHVPLIFLTAGSRDPARQFKGYDAGAVDFLYKPIDPIILKSKADVFFRLQRQKMELECYLQEQRDMLHFNEMFMAVLGHDLRNPLNTILTSAEVVSRTVSEPMPQSAAMRIMAASRRMGRLVNDMLDLARARLAGGIAIQTQPTDLGALLQRVLQEHRAASPGRSIQVRQSGDLTGEWDADRLAQVLSNLVGNALKHGEADAEVEVSLDGSDPREISIAVSNRGEIAPEAQARLFEPFGGGTRAQARKSEGLGLGLYIVQQIVTAHQGSVEFRSTGGTTRFLARLPRISLDSRTQAFRDE